MTIIFVVDSFPTISETFILNQITGMLDLGHEVLIFSNTRSNESNVHTDVRKYDLLKKTYYLNEKPANKFHRLGWALALIFTYGHRNPKAVINALNFFKYGKEALSLNYLYMVMLFLGKKKADIIFCHYGPNGNRISVLKEMGIAGKLVCMFHGYDIRRGLAQPGLYAPLFKYADSILSISAYSYQHLLSFEAPALKIHHHPVGVDTSRYERIAPKTIKAQGIVKILSVGRLVPEKGIEEGLKAIYQLVFVKNITRLEYFIIGEGPLREILQQQAIRLGLEGKVFFLGYQTQEGVEKLLDQAHLFFLPSEAEVLPVVLMEAQAAGLPVVATDIGSVRQIILENQSGFLVPANDPSQMAQKLEHLIRHPEQWPTMGKIGREHIKEHFDIKRLNLELNNLFKKLV